MVYGGVDIILFHLALTVGRANFLAFGFIFALFNLGVLYFSAKSLVSLVLIMEASRDMSLGNLDYELDMKQISPIFKAFAHSIKTSQIGMRKAVEEAVKGEQMKTSLITNVSHDLKNPLTSIITYVIY